MSFSKAEQLLELASMVAARHSGVKLDEVSERFNCSYRTAQRMMLALESAFPDVTTSLDESGFKRWRLGGGHLRELMNISSDEMAAIDLAAEQFEQSGLSTEAKTLQRLKDKILALVPRQTKSRIETDHEVLLEARGLIARPGPKPKFDDQIFLEITESIKAGRVLNVLYHGFNDEMPKQKSVIVYGFLFGMRHYVVVREAEKASAPIKTYRLDGIKSASLTEEACSVPDNFDLHEFATRAFGVYQNDTEYGEVVWKFRPEVASHVEAYQFHPNQGLELSSDGSVIVRFKAAGILEMCWHLYCWGDKVEVLEPAKLRKLVEGFRRSDFDGLP